MAGVVVRRRIAAVGHWFEALFANYAAMQRLQRYWHLKHHHGWERQLHELDHAIRKDGFAHAGAHALLYGAPHARSRLLSFALPAGEEAWRAAAAVDPLRLWVHKPATASCGVGIVVGALAAIDESVQRSGALPSTIQEYRASPLLLGGLKWDMRCYAVAVAGEENAPTRLFLFRDGLARFATEQYTSAAEGGALSSAAHLTNYTLQLAGTESGARRFVEASDAAGSGGLDESGAVKCHKWSAAVALAFVAREASVAVRASRGTADVALDAEGAPAAALSENGCSSPPSSPSWQRVGDAVSVAVRDALGVARPVAAAAEAAEGAQLGRPPPEGRAVPSSRRFELFGVDVLLESDGQPSVLELQRCPSLEPSSLLDVRVKTELLDALGRLLAACASTRAVDSHAWRELDASPRPVGAEPPDASALREWHRVDALIAGEVLAVGANFEKALCDFRAQASDGYA